MTDDQKAIDISEALLVQAESLAEHHDELRALSVNVANLQELVRVQQEALEYAANQVSELRDVPGYAAALAKYNEMMGGGDDE